MKAITLTGLAMGLLSACTQPSAQDGASDDLPTGKADGGFSPAELAGAVRAANTLTLAELDDAGLSTNARGNIVAHRDGADGVAGTADDDLFDDIAELDAVPYVGPVAIGLLVDYARDAGWTSNVAAPLAQLPLTGSMNDMIGSAVAVNDHLLAVGAYLTRIGPGTLGKIYMFERSGGTWTPAGEIAADTGVMGLGGTLLLDGDTLLTTGSTHVGSYSNRHVYLYDRSASGWTLSATVSAPTVFAGPGWDGFASGVAIEGDDLAVADIATTSEGQVRLYHRSAGQWTAGPVLVSPSGEHHVSFGRSLALANGVLVVGSPNDGPEPFIGGPGAAYAYDLTGTRWQGARKLEDPSASLDRFAHSVATDGDRIAIAAEHETGGGGVAEVFERSGDQWTHANTLTLPDNNSHYSDTVAIDGDTLAVGDDDASLTSGSREGAVFVYARDNGGWSLAATHRGSEPGAGFGSSLSLRAGLLAAGAPGANSKVGAAYAN